MPADPSQMASPAQRRDRRLVLVETALSRGDYGETREREERFEVDSITVANLVSSVIVGGTHAPCFDLDMEAVLTRGVSGDVTCWVDAPLRGRGYAKLITAGVAGGLFRPADCSRAGRRIGARRKAYAAERARALNSSARDDVLKSLGTDLGDTLEQCISTAAIVAGPRGMAVGNGPDLHNPWAFPLAVPASLVPSTHHFHLYLDVEISWNSFREVLQLAKQARLLEAGYVKASLNRGSTHLRLPWVEKDPFGN